MFTLEQIKTAHAKVKSGADFPQYIRELKTLGVDYYETYVTDGHAVYAGNGGSTLTSSGKYEPLVIAEQSNATAFQNDLKAHQQGQSDYMTFCWQSATHGIEKWVVDLQAMTCTYYDLSGNAILVERIPS